MHGLFTYLLQGYASVVTPALAEIVINCGLVSSEFLICDLIFAEKQSIRLALLWDDVWLGELRHRTEIKSSAIWVYDPRSKASQPPGLKSSIVSLRQAFRWYQVLGQTLADHGRLVLRARFFCHSIPLCTRFRWFDSIEVNQESRLASVTIKNQRQVDRVKK